MATLIKIDRNGSKHYEGMVTCDRCNGLGLYAVGVCNDELVITTVDSGVCHKCGGKGKVLSKWIERTPEYQAKLDAKHEARMKAFQEKIEAEAAAKAAEEAAMKAAREAEAKAAEEARLAARAKSQHVGQVGDKVQLTLTYMRTAKWDSMFGMQYLHMFVDADGNAFVWKTSEPIGKRWKEQIKNTDDWQYRYQAVNEGEDVVLKGSIKEHSEYDGQKQTVLTRCKIL